MKKSIFAIGLLSLVMILTSFTTTETNEVSVNNINTTLQAVGSGGTKIGTPKLDAVGSGGTKIGTPKLDAVGSGGTKIGTPKLD